MDVLTIIYLVYSFLSFYFIFFFLLIYIPHRKDFSKFPVPIREYSISFVVPCYNEEKDIGGTIEALLNSDYIGLKQIIVVDDCSTDGSWNIIKKYAGKHKEILAVQTPKNTGNAGGSKLYGATFVDTELIGFTDSDSYPDKSGIRKMVGFFNNPKVGAVSSMVLVKRRDNFLEKVQAIEYKIIAFTRRLLGFVEAIYVTPGPLAIYRKEAYDKVGGFDVTNMTEDIEITWAIVKEGYKVEMASMARVYSVAPRKIKDWIKQRIRWSVGGIQTINKYKKHFGSRNVGMLGKFILPFFLFNWILGVFGISVLFYRIIQTLAVRYLSTTYSIENQAAIFSLSEINLAPSILFFFGITTLILSIIILFIALSRSKEEDYKNPGLIVLFVYFTFYLLTYPIILFTALYKFFRGNYSW